jgi:adenylate cyclase
LKRRLAAVLAADVVGYSAMVQRDEAGTIRTVRGHIGSFEPQLALHHGRIVKKMGDGFLAEFPSVVEAVACADILQKTAAERNRKLDDADRAVFRIGVHAGDIIEDEDDIFGDGVNIASRLEGIAAPGSVAISAKVFEDVDGRLDLAFKDLGPQHLKNIQKPVRVYEIDAGAMAVPERRQHDLPDKPSIAVLPMQAFSGDLDDEFLADGLTEDLTTALSSIPWLFVIARNSAFTYKGLAVDIRRISKELGVRYIVEGSVRRAGSRVRISAQLADATDGKHIWADKYDGQIDDVFDLQDRIVSQIVRAVAPHVQMAEIRKSARKRPGDRNSYDLYLGALNHLYCARIEEAEKLLNNAIEIDPDYASAKAILAWCSTLRIAWELSAKETVRETGVRLCKEALESARRDVETEAYCGYTLGFHMADIERGMELVAGAVEKCPNFAWAWVSRSFLETFFGDPQRALEYAETALRLNPRDPLIHRTYHALTTAYSCMEDYDKALDTAQEGLKYNPNIAALQLQKVLVLSKMNRPGEAKAEAANLMLRHPDFRVSRFLSHTGRFRIFAGAAEILIASGLAE